MITAVRGRSSKQSYILWNGIAISVLNCRLWNPQNLKLITDFQRGEPKRRISKQWKGISFWTISLCSLSDSLSPFRLLGSAPSPRKHPNGCFRLPSKVRQPLRRSAQKEMPQAVSHDTACGMVFISPATVRSGVFPLRAPAVQRQSGADCLHFS